jgi:RNA polymerase sigma factor (sigma-70 family)
MPPPAAHLLDHVRRLATRLAAGRGADAELLARFVHQGDESAFAELVDRYGPMVLGVCRRALADAASAADAFQATFLVLARKAGALRRPEALAGWLHGVALRLARKARVAARRPGGWAQVLSDAVPDPRPDPLAELSARELLAALDAEVGRLPEAHRLPVLLCCLEGLSQGEAAARRREDCPTRLRPTVLTE